jgi:hypothetical protein
MVIHLITAGKYQNQEDWPEIWVKCFNSWAKTKHDICIWNDEGIDRLLQEDDNVFYKQYLSKLDPIYKWDYVRYLILKKYGGAYFDMDVELIDDYFFYKLHPSKIYLMEGTCGTYIENSIMISPLTKLNKDFWKRIQTYSKNKILNKFNDCSNPHNVVWTVGAQLLSEFFLTQSPHKDHRQYYDILAWEHFGNVEGTINFTKHYQTWTWDNDLKAEQYGNRNR